MSFVFRRHGLIIFLAVFILALVVGILPRPLIAIYNQNKAGRFLAEGMNSNAGVTACEMPPLTDNNVRSNIQAAVALLNQAISYEPRYSQSYLHLGHAYCLLGKFDKAVEAFKMYIQLRPDNALGHLELGFAEQNQCVDQEKQQMGSVVPAPTSSEIGVCQDQNLNQVLHSEWHKYGINTNQFLSRARQSFTKKEYAASNLWYQRAIKFQLASMDELPSSDQIKWAVSTILTQSTLPQSLAERLPILETTCSTTITANELRWFREITNRNVNYGDLVSVKDINMHKVGVLYYGGPVGVFINVQQDGWYQVSVQALNTPPAPVILRIEDGFQSFGELELARGDYSWQIFQFKVFLQQGVHLLDIYFVNDEVINNVDRNAIIEWIKLDCNVQ